nr:hypothetical protein HK105_007002 [Polyrhizophydium stewartii]
MVAKRTQLPILEERIAYKRFVTVWHRHVEFPDGRKLDCAVQPVSLTTAAWLARDAGGHGTRSPAFVTVFPFNTKTKTVRLLIEYAQGPNVMTYTLTAGACDPTKHSSILDTARHELSEEARLKNGTWVRLLPEDDDGIPELKWSRNKFVPFLVIDAEPDATPYERDAEEFIEIVDVTLDELQQFILKGLVMLPSVQTTIMALDWLRRNGHAV